MDELETRDPGGQPGKPGSVASPKAAYTSPRVIVYGSLTVLTQGSGGQYGDECTSGQHDEDERF
jgi:hypothetical protein